MATAEGKEIFEAQKRAQEIFDKLQAEETRPVLLWLCSHLRRWEGYAAWVEPTENVNGND